MTNISILVNVYEKSTYGQGIYYSMKGYFCLRDDNEQAYLKSEWMKYFGQDNFISSTIVDVARKVVDMAILLKA